MTERQYLWGARGTAAATIAARLRFENLSHSYDRVPVIHDVSLDIEPGEIIGLLGVSGCGKTTLLRIVAGVERQTFGRVLINEQEIAGPQRFLPPEQRGIGLIFQDYALFPHLTILDNVMFGLAELSRLDAEREARASLRRVGLEYSAFSYPHMLSGGEQQRVALARAIAPRPSVVMMDEPFSGLDRRMRDDIRNETLAILRETRATCILVTHDPEEAIRLADRIALMRSGRLVQVGSPRELYRNPIDLFVARFFSEFNKIRGEFKADAIVTPIGNFKNPFSGVLTGCKFDVCIRPQGVLLSGNKGKYRGRILHRRFLGDVDLAEVAVASLEIPLISYIPANFSLLPGEEVAVTFDPCHVLIFPVSGDGSVEALS
ncbi:MAG: ABC transporter ATP-binding protein [Alphaproteobacteria bacterium]|nr:ABC transporter ATP-binding protein [Alphaproteobacteria bacterium]